MATGGLAVELEATHPQLPNDLTVSESRQPTHSGCDHDGIVAPFTGSRETWGSVAFAPGINQLPSDITRDLKRLGNRPTLRHEAGKFIRGRKE